MLKKTIQNTFLWKTLKHAQENLWNPAHANASRTLLKITEPYLGQLVVSANSYGLCNRIKCLISSMRIAQKFSRRMGIYWPKNADCYCRFSDLFENPITEFNEAMLNEIKKKASQVQSNQYFIVDTWRLLIFKNELPNDFAQAFPSKRGNDIDHEFNRIPSAVRAEFLHYLSQLIPKKNIRKAVEEFSCQFDDRTVSFHIRSWPDLKVRADSLFKIENVYRMMDRLEGSNFFVSCDSEDVLRKVCERYGKRAFYYPKRTFTNDRSPIGMQDSLIDILLLAKSKKMKTSYLSTFSEMAWWYGGAMAEVEDIESSEDIEICRQKKVIHGHDASFLIPPGILE